MKFKNHIFLIIVLFTPTLLFAQENNHIIKVNKQGKMIWKDTNEDAFFWGVNYTTPFAHAFRQIARVGKDRKKAIDEDTYHFARLGINAYRIHVWDCEISDSIGNLLENEHLDLLDYLIYRLQQRDIYSFITPIAYWGNGYPEPDEDLPGFSRAFSKERAYTDPKAVVAQERYLKQFVSHVNPYTGKAYKDDPMIVGFEVCNEPAHSIPKETTLFVRRMISAIHSTGCKKPVFYNVTQNIRLLEDFIKGGTDGVTFQWYPTGLVAGHEQRGNFLHHVDKYDMPFQDEAYFHSQARLVYEFDAADIGRSYMYPPMAISFKEAGMQWATMFAYDPMAIAESNTEYQTHFLNLAYTPQKAIGFKIAGELFRNSQYNRDRTNEKSPFEMNDVIISYEKDLSELSTNQLFFYTNTTVTLPKNPATLQSVAGYGSSPVVAYKGRGAYFLDKISDDTWRLEVLPDAIWVRDPFSRATPRIENVVIKYNEYPMTVQIPALGTSFSVTGVNDGNRYTTTAVNGQFIITPGAYILSAKPFTGNPQEIKVGTISANEFYAPVEKNDQLYVLHQPQTMIMEGQPVQVAFEIVSPQPVKQLTLQMSGRAGDRGSRPLQIPLTKQDQYLYSATIPDTLVLPGIMNYVVKVEFLSGKELIYPGAVKGPTTSWEYYNPQTYSVKVLPKKTGIQLYSAESGETPIIWSSGVQLQTIFSGITGETKAKISQAPARLGFTPRRDDRAQAVFVLESFVKPQIEAIQKYAKDYSQVVIAAKAEKDPVSVEVSLISKAGGIYTGRATLTSDKATQSIPLNSLAPGKMMLLPRPFPGFLPFWYANPKQQSFNLSEIERIQFVIPSEGNIENPSIEIKSIYIE